MATSHQGVIYVDTTRNKYMTLSDGNDVSWSGSPLAGHWATQQSLVLFLVLNFLRLFEYS